MVSRGESAHNKTTRLILPKYSLGSHRLVWTRYGLGKRDSQNYGVFVKISRKPLFSITFLRDGLSILHVFTHKQWAWMFGLNLPYSNLNGGSWSPTIHIIVVATTLHMIFSV